MPDQDQKLNQSIAADEKTQAISDSGNDLGNNSAQGQSHGDSEITGPEGVVVSDAVSLLHRTLAGGKYQVTEELGRGGMSVVYAATDVTLGRVVAVKVLLAEYAQAVGQEAVMRFQQEARAVARLSHPHIISIYEYGILEDGAPFIVMDYIVGLSLADEMEQHGLMPEARVLEIIKQSAEALRHSHGQGVVHRDIKPSNILVTRGDDGEDFVRLVDFGIAKMPTQDKCGKLTRTGQVFGSPLYMSPEQCEGLVADARSDIYSLGCLAYELITGRPPHMGKNVVETMHRKMTIDPTPFAHGLADSSKNKKGAAIIADEQESRFKLALQEIILKMLAVDPDKRQQNADELISEIRRLKAGMPLLVVPQPGRSKPALLPLPSPQWRPALVALAGGVVLVIGGATWYYSQPLHDVKPVHHFTPVGERLTQWRAAESAGQRALESGDLSKAKQRLETALKSVERLKGSDKMKAEDVSLSDLIDLAQVQGNVHADQGLWQRYQAMILIRNQGLHDIDQALITAMKIQDMAYKSGQTPDPKLVDELIDRTFAQVKEEFADERFGAAARLTESILPILRKRQREDGSLARAYHTLASIVFINGNWQRALDYAEQACDASQGNDKALRANLAQALFYQGWAQAKLNQNPEGAFRKALELNREIGPHTAINRLDVWTKLALYYQEHNQPDQAQNCAKSGIKLANEGEFSNSAQADRLINLASYYDVCGRSADAIEAAREGLEFADCSLPRQDYKVMQGLKSLAKYYRSNGQKDLAAAVLARAGAMQYRLKEFDKIYSAALN